MTEEISDTTDLDMAFDGLSGEAQGYIVGMPDHEVAALERALLLT